MKNKAAFILFFLVLFISCKEDNAKEPKRLIDKETMVNIMYDLSLIEAFKYQSVTASDSIKVIPSEFILKKYKVDSLQFAQNNVYYATDFKEYKKMVDTVSKRFETKKKELEALVKAQSKKALLKKKALIKSIKTKDTIKKQRFFIN